MTSEYDNTAHPDFDISYLDNTAHPAFPPLPSQAELDREAKRKADVGISSLTVLKIALGVIIIGSAVLALSI